MSESLSLQCPACAARIRAPMQLLGKKRACPGCGYGIVVRLPPPEDQDVVLLMDDHESQPVVTARRSAW